MNDISELLEDYEIYKNKIRDFSRAYELKKGPSEMDLMLNADSIEKIDSDKIHLPDHRMIQVKLDKFKEEILEIKKKLIAYLIEFKDKVSNKDIDIKDAKNNEINIKLEKELVFGKDYWKFLAENFYMDYPLLVFDCIFSSEKIIIEKSNDPITSLNRSLGLLVFLGKAESNEDEKKLLKINWSNLMSPKAQKNPYSKIFKEIGISRKPINTLDFSKSNNLDKEELKKNIADLSSFLQRIGLRFPVLKKIDTNLYDFNCYGKYLWKKFGLSRG
jgi:hypothetical protein